jgi:hypothetical protein
LNEDLVLNIHRVLSSVLRMESSQSRGRAG